MPKFKKCSFLSCPSSQGASKVRFFRFPVKNKDICNQWVVNCANNSLVDISDSALGSRVVCELHFSEQCFTSTLKTRLLRDSVPTLFVIDHENQLTPRPGVSSTPSPVSLALANPPPPPPTSPPTPKTPPPPPTTPLLPLTQPLLLPATQPVISTADTPRKVKLKRSLLKKSKLLRRINEKARRDRTKKVSPIDAYKAASKHIESQTFCV